MNNTSIKIIKNNIDYGNIYINKNKFNENYIRCSKDNISFSIPPKYKDIEPTKEMVLEIINNATKKSKNKTNNTIEKSKDSLLPEKRENIESSNVYNILTNEETQEEHLLGNTNYGNNPKGKLLGTDETFKKIYLNKGPYGFYLRCTDNEYSKILYSVPDKINNESFTIDQAVNLIVFSNIFIKPTEDFNVSYYKNDKPVYILYGKYGWYIQWDNNKYNIPDFILKKYNEFNLIDPIFNINIKYPKENTKFISPAVFLNSADLEKVINYKKKKYT